MGNLKRIWIFVLSISFLVFFTAYVIKTEAFTKTSDEMPKFTYSSKVKNQVYGYFMLDLYHSEIMKAIKDFYKDNKITGYKTPTPPHYDMVSILAGVNDIHYKGYSYLLKIKLLPEYNNGKVLGEDTLFFAVEPNRQTMKNLPHEYPPIKLIKYEHSTPPKNEN